MIAAAIVTFYLESIRQAWEFVLESGAGIGLVLILRWYWWRVNAWSEIAAMVAPPSGSRPEDVHDDRVSLHAACGRGMDDRVLARRDVSHPAGTGCAPDRVLPARAAGRSGMAAHCRAGRRSAAWIDRRDLSSTGRLGWRSSTRCSSASVRRSSGRSRAR